TPRTSSYGRTTASSCAGPRSSAGTAVRTWGTCLTTDRTRRASASASTRQHSTSSRKTRPARPAAGLPVRLHVDQALTPGFPICPGEDQVRQEERRHGGDEESQHNGGDRQQGKHPNL